jgi:hypothetical protein
MESKAERAGFRVTQDKSTPINGERKPLYQKVLASSYYGLLGVPPSASVQEIRQAYRDLSKLYHPDTTSLPAAIATTKFQELNEAYATLSSPERRLVYDRKIGYSRIPVVQPLLPLTKPDVQNRVTSSSAYLDPTDRPLSAGEIFALFILGLTFLACLVLAIAIGMTRGDAVFQPLAAQSSLVPQIAKTIQSKSAQSESVQPKFVQPTGPLVHQTTEPSPSSNKLTRDSVDFPKRSHGTSSS